MPDVYPFDPLLILLVSYLIGTLVCGAWTLALQAIRTMSSRATRCVE